MVCQHCSGKGTIAKVVGIGIYYFGPCLECDVQHFNQKRAEHELEHMLETLGTNNYLVKQRSRPPPR